MKPADKQQKTAPPRGKPVRKPSSGSISFLAIALNIGLAIVAVLFISAIFEHHERTQEDPLPRFNAGYDFSYTNVVKGNLEIIEQNPGKTLDEKYFIKWHSAEKMYMDSVRKLTPDTAIIMLPPKEVLRQVQFKSVVDLPWITYFLYPRRIVYGDSVRDPLYDRAQYMVSLNGWGLDRMNPPVERPTPFMVLPIRK